MDYMCRICGKDEENPQNLLNLFSGSLKGIVAFIKSHLHINIGEDDFLPTKICQRCLVICDHFLLFSVICDQAQLILNHKANYLNINNIAISTLPALKILESEVTRTESPANSPDTTINQVNYETKMRSENENNVQVQETDQSMWTNENSISENTTPIPQKTEIEMENQPLQSKNDTTEIEEDDAEVIELSNHNDKSLPQKQQSENTASTIIELDTESENDEEMPPPMTPPMKRLFNCPICLITTVNRKQLSAHFRMNHPETSLFCQKCDYATIVKDRLNQHIKECHDKNFKCLICHNNFGKKSKLSMHINDMHTNNRELTCNLCEKTFVQKYEFQQHEKSDHIINGRWTCTTCPHDKEGDISFAQRHQLEIHMNKKHLANRKLYCSVPGCKFTAQHKYYMTQHNREVHDKKFRCKECGKAESKLSRIKEHMLRKHTPKEERCCPVCQKTFTSKGWYDRHMLAGTCGLQTNSYYPAITVPFLQTASFSRSLSSVPMMPSTTITRYDTIRGNSTIHLPQISYTSIKALEEYNQANPTNNLLQQETQQFMEQLPQDFSVRVTQSHKLSIAETPEPGNTVQPERPVDI